ncbi:MAG: lipid-A-disaccharide synthase [Elusimicrobiota bacterium]|jgi:lipid-A-disaccharide synthase|nr:lipid-A-disaccharide synthase [Elusimicrobiota bacterium]
MINIFISAGDLSGEIHSFNLAKEMKAQNPHIKISAVGGRHLQEISDIFIEDIVNINAFGFFPIKQFLFLRKVLSKIKRHFVEQKPQKIVLVDYYGFNIHIAKLAKKMNIPVYYFVSPQVWASRSGRIEKLKIFVKKMLLIFPFEEKLYRDKGVDAVFVGNPLIDKIPQKENFTISDIPLIGLFPGSRKDTMRRHIPVLIAAAKILRKKINASFIMFSHYKDFKEILPDYISLDDGNDLDTRKSIDIAICPSGTVSLENTLFGIPMAVMYKLSYINYFIIRLLIKVKYIAITNILANRQILPEFIQNNAKPEKIADFIIKELEHRNYENTVKELITIRQMLGKPNVCKRVAEIILKD